MGQDRREGDKRALTTNGETPEENYDVWVLVEGKRVSVYQRPFVTAYCAILKTFPRFSVLYAFFDTLIAFCLSFFYLLIIRVRRGAVLTNRNSIESGRDRVEVVRRPHYLRQNFLMARFSPRRFAASSRSSSKLTSGWSLLNERRGFFWLSETEKNDRACSISISQLVSVVGNAASMILKG